MMAWILCFLTHKLINVTHLTPPMAIHSSKSRLIGRQKYARFLSGTAWLWIYRHANLSQLKTMTYRHGCGGRQLAQIEYILDVMKMFFPGKQVFARQSIGL